MNIGERVKKVLYPVLHRRTLYAYAEALIVAMVHDEEKVTRILGYRRLLNAKNSEITRRSSVHHFTWPDVNFEAKTYIDMIDWQAANVIDPPLLKHITNDELKNLIQSGDVPQSNVPQIPCHSQNVEHMIKLGWMSSALLSRSSMPTMSTFETKKQFATHM